ncbi:ATP-binding protein [Agrococcus sp. Ld7]|uniref:ATP-binding protein n=1 Tax=Agrococcus sp. Ld7 TaxID=649148 RepID=UPI0038649C93
MSRWVLEQLQLVNWGGYDGGPHRIFFDDDMTLLTGGSGTGKSTLLDAYMVLISDSSTALNGASNDLGGGRARGEGQRNVLNYIRGLYAVLDNEDGVTEFKLREGDAWGAIAATYRADAGDGLFGGEPQRFTAMRVYYAKAGASRDGELIHRRFTIDSAFDLGSLEEHVDHRFQPAKVKAAYDGLRGYETYQSFAQALIENLSIGSAANGNDAINLLARVQSGGRVPSVAALYQQYVLDEPATFEAALNAVRSFDEYQSGRRSYETALAQRKTLEPIRQAQASRLQAASDIAASDILRPDDAGGPFAHWKAQQLARRATIATHAAEREFETKRALASDTAAAHGNARAALERAVDLVAAAGGGKLDDLQGARARAADRVDSAKEQRQQFEAIAPTAAANVHDEESFALEQLRAQELIGGTDAEAEARRAAQTAAEAHSAARSEHKELADDVRSLEGRSSNISKHLIDKRDQMADAANLRPQDVPFVAELLDMAPAHEGWRVAADAVLGGFATRLLIDERHYDHFRDSINSLRMPTRMRYTGVDTSLGDAEHADHGTLAGKLVIADGPFRGWLTRQIARAAEHRCVETVQELLDDGIKRVTRSGQERHGQRGAHGGGQERLIGFDNRTKLEELTRLRDNAEKRAAELQRAWNEAGDRVTAIQEAKRDAQYVLTLKWHRLDVRAAQQELGDIDQQLAALLDGNSDLSRAKDARDEAARREETENEARIGAKNAAADSDAAYERAMQRETQAEAELASFSGEVDMAVAERLDEDLRAYVSDDDADPKSLNVAVSSVQAKARQLRTEGQKTIEAAGRLYESAVSSFQDQWKHPSIGLGWASYSEYLEILERHEADRSAESLHKWNLETISGVSAHLSGLHGAYASAMREVSDRLYAVNELLAEAPFGPKRGTLQIVEQQAIPSDVRQLKGRLSKLGRYTIDEVEADQIDEVYESIALVIDELRTDLATDKRRLLDVRRHMKISAGVFVDGRTSENFTNLAAKSGGETQELVAFILGAAIRYQLGSDDGRPQFSTIILDEAFIKADSKFTERSIGAWKKLGFQLIVGAPYDKTSTLDPFAGVILATVKDDDSNTIQVVDARVVEHAAA